MNFERFSLGGKITLFDTANERMQNVTSGVQAEAVTRKVEIKSSEYFPNFLIVEILLIKYIV